MILLQSLASELSLPVLINIHNVAQAKAYTERIVGLRHGKMIFDGAPDDFTRDALDAIYGGIESPEEEPVAPANPPPAQRERPAP
jgi:phosphonate transport system ATP-binding protein